MRATFAVSIALAGVLAIPSASGADEVSVAALRGAAQKGLVLLEQTSPTFLKKGGCNSCHNQLLPAFAQAFARQRGVPAGEPIAQLPPELSETTLERFIEYAPGGGSGISGLGYELFARSATNRTADDRVRAQIYFIKGMQQPEGHWRAGANRPPLTFDDFTSTAFVIRALNTYSPEVEIADTRRRVDRARTWLLKASPKTTQERAFRLLGLAWSKSSRSVITEAVRGLQSMQRKDGGWSQLEALPSDAYATGMALYALYEAGVPVSEVTYQAGLRYLLETQAADGTWHVKARSLPLQPYFESGYPYEHDQWISSAGAAYATIAIAAALPNERDHEEITRRPRARR